MTNHTAQTMTHWRIASLLLTGLAICSAASCHRGTRDDSTASPVRSSDMATVPDLAGIHNLQLVDGGVWSGSVPEGDEGFDALASLGIRTVIAVDAATPDLDRLHARGMRSIHIPIQYAGMEDDARVALARAVRDAEGPVYIHCHHGKHRGPAAAAAALVALGRMTTAEGHAYLVRAGTSPKYPGLYESVRTAGSVDAATIDQWSGDLPEIADLGGLAPIMAKLDSHFDMLEQLADASWEALPDDPDRTAGAEAGIVYDLLRASAETSTHTEPEYTTVMNLAIAQAERVENALRQNNLKAADEALLMLGDSCVRCHTTYRTKR